MRYVKWTLPALVLLLIFAFLHYTLPQHDVVRVVNTEVQRMDPGSNSWFWSSAPSGSAASQGTRDVRFIESFYPNGKPMVFRNEDTGWGWPPYFKFDSANLQAVARDLTSTSDKPRWIEVTHYGWRNEWFTIFPNAVSIRPVSGPDHSSVNWFNMFFFTVLAVALFMLWRLWRRFRRRQIDPMLEDLDDATDAARSSIGRIADRLFRRKR